MRAPTEASRDRGVLTEEFFINELGIDFADVLHERNVSLPTVHLEADFRQRLKYGDRIDMEVRILELGRSSIRWGYKGYRVPDWLRQGPADYTARLEPARSAG